MPSIDLRHALNAISDVVNNRPRPLREFDQIYMKSADMLMHTDHISGLFDSRTVLFVGDGDAIGLSLVHLHRSGILTAGPQRVHIVDFDERVIRSIEEFARRFGIDDCVSCELYNVVDPLPSHDWRTFDSFHTNPPFGASNDGRSVEAFVRRGMEGVSENGIGCIIVADDPRRPWTQAVLRSTQSLILESGFVISEVIPHFHKYHLDDDPNLTSCSMIIRRLDKPTADYVSAPLGEEFISQFYGTNAPLRVQFIRDKTNGGKLSSRDHEIERI